MAIKTQDELQQEEARARAASATQTANNTAGSVAETQNGGSSGGYHVSYSSTISAPTVEPPPPSQLPSQIPANVEHQDVPDAPDLRPELDKWLAAAQEQANNQIDYATQQGITELERAQEDAQPQFQTMRNQIDADEAKALDNQVLYAEARGDKGGIGQAQYGSIQNTAAQNRLQVQQQQTKLATDTARQIADLRARGEFEKADKMLQLTQTYLSQLMQLEQWAAEYNMNAAQFRESIAQWEAEYNMKVAQILEDQRQWDANYNLQLASFQQGQREWEEEFGWTQQQAEQKTLAGAGEALLAAGIMPSEAQLAAMGMTKEQARSYIAALQLSLSSGGGSGGGGGGGGSGSGTTVTSGMADYIKSNADTAAQAIQNAVKGLTGTTPGNGNTKLPAKPVFNRLDSTGIAVVLPKGADKNRVTSGGNGTLIFQGRQYSETGFMKAFAKAKLTDAQRKQALADLRKLGFDVSKVQSGTGKSGGGGGTGKNNREVVFN